MLHVEEVLALLLMFIGFVKTVLTCAAVTAKGSTGSAALMGTQLRSPITIEDKRHVIVA